jgi:hypothetical protein
MAKRPTQSGGKKVRGRTGVVNEMIEERKRPRNRTDEVKIWEQRIDLGVREAKDYMLDFAANACAYVGKPWSEVENQTDAIMAALKSYSISVNRTLPSVAAQNAQLMPRIPWFRLSSNKPGADEEAMKAAEGVLNFMNNTDKMSYLMHSRLMLLGAQIGVGYRKVTYTPEEGIEPDDGEAQYGEIEALPDSQGQLKIDVKGGIPYTDPKTGEWQLRKGGKILLDNRNPADYFKNDWKDWRDMVHDPEGGNDLADHSWVAERRSWTVEEFKANKMFRGIDRRDVEYAAVSLLHDPQPAEKRKRLDTSQRGASKYGYDYSPPEIDLLRVWGYEVWDIRNREVLYLVDGLDKVAAKLSYPGWVDVSPYTILKFNEVPGEFYPYPEITPSRALAKAYNMFWSMLLNHLRRFNRKYVAEQGVFTDPQQKEAFKDPEDGVVVEVTNVNGVVPVLDAPLDPAIYKMMDQAIADQSEIQGTSPEARGIAQSGSATQAALIDRRSTSRENDKRAIFGGALKRNAKIMLDCLQANLDQTMAYRILGPDGKMWDNVVSRADIIGDWDTNIDLTELEPHDIAQEKRDTAAMLQILTPSIAFLSPTFTKKFFEVWNWNDPQIAKEFTEIAEFMAAGGPRAVQGAGGPGAEGQGPPARGGAKPVGQGKEEGRTTEGRSIGRGERGRGGGVGGPTLLGPGNTPPQEAA